MNAGRLLLLSVIRPSIEYGSEVWEGNKSQAGSFESIIIESVHSISRDERDAPLTQYITNAGIYHARYTIPYFNEKH